MMKPDQSTQLLNAPSVSGTPLKEKITGFFTQFRLGPVLIVLVLVWALFAIQNPRFLSPVNISNLSVQITVTATLALGLVFVLLLGEIDLSVAALSGVVAAATANLAVHLNWNPVLAILAGIALGVAWSLLQGLIVMFGAPSFIVTLAGSLALGGVLLVLLPKVGQITLSSSPLRAIAGTYLPPALGWGLAAIIVIVIAWFFLKRSINRGRRGLSTSTMKQVILPIAGSIVLAGGVVGVMNAHRGVPAMFAAFMVITLILAYVMTQTKLGTQFYAVGGNREAARRAGIPVGRTVMTAFAFAGVFAALGGIFAASRLLGVSNQSGGGTLLLEAIAAAVIGGTSLFGGKGTIWSALLGALLIGSISNGMDLLGLSTETKMIVTGVILVIATVADVVISRGSFSLRGKK